MSETIKSKWYYLLPSLFEVFIIFIFALHLKFPAERSYLLWQHIELGKQDIKTHSIVTDDPFSYTKTRPLKRSSWLSDDIFYLMFVFTGYKGLITLKIVLLAIMVFLPFILFNNDSLIYSIFAPLYLLLLSPGASLRPTLFGMFMFFVFHLFYRKKRPLLMGITVLLWSFIHGSYIIGTLILAVSFVFSLKNMTRQDRIKWIAGILISSVPLVLSHSSMDMFVKLGSQKYILNTFDEWRSPNFKNFLGVLFFLFIIGWIGSLKQRWKNESFTIGALLLFLSLYARRFIPLFAIFSFVDIARGINIKGYQAFKEYLNESTKRPLWLILFLVYFAVEAPGFEQYFIKQYHPYGCEKLLNDYPEGTKILTLQAWVPYLFFSTKGKFKYAVDGTLSQEDSILSAYEKFWRGDGCCEELNVLSPDILIFPSKYYEKFKNCCQGCLKIEHIDSVCVLCLVNGQNR